MRNRRALGAEESEWVEVVELRFSVPEFPRTSSAYSEVRCSNPTDFFSKYHPYFVVLRCTGELLQSLK